MKGWSRILSSPVTDLCWGKKASTNERRMMDFIILWQNIIGSEKVGTDIRR